MTKEVDDHIAHKHWEVIPKSQVPKGTRSLDMVWGMWCKRKISSREIYEWKARLNVHGGQQQYRVNYWETYAPIVTWQTLWFFFVLGLLCGWHSRQINFIMAYPQAPTEVPLYMKMPSGYSKDSLPKGPD